MTVRNWSLTYRGGRYGLKTKKLAAAVAGLVSLSSVFVAASADAATTNRWEPSGQAMPVGNSGAFRQVYRNDFVDMSFPLGSFTGCNRYGCQGAPGAGVGATPAGTPDTNGVCQYQPAKVLSITGGVLTMHIHTGRNGVCDVANVYPLAPPIKFGRYSIRFRADDLTGYHLVDLLWPVNGVDGEIDFPENNLGSPFNGFLHRWAGGLPFDYYLSNVDNGQWHTATTIWTSSGVHYYLDGVKLPENGPTLLPAPTTPHTLALRVESGEGVLRGHRPSASVAGTVQIDWVTVYQYK